MEWFLYISIGVMIPWDIYLLYLIIKIEINDRKKLVFPEYQQPYPAPVLPEATWSPNMLSHNIIVGPTIERDYFIPSREYNDFKPKKIIMAHSFYKRNGVHFDDDPTEIEQRVLLPGPEYPWYGGNGALYRH